MLKHLFLFAFILGIHSCVEISQPFSKIPPGIWRAELTLDKEVILPFNFEISYDESDELIMTIHNADERIVISDISFGRDKKLQDTLVIEFPLMDTYLNLKYKENVLEGMWHVPNRDASYKIPFVAFHGQGHRFSTRNLAPTFDAAGLWATTFEIETPDAYPAVGEFHTDGNKLTGTFRTETGDYRYLQGNVFEDKLHLSVFDGSHAFLFNGTFSNDETIIGEFYSGKHYKTNWIATKDENASLRDPSSITNVITEDRRISLTLPDTEGNLISIDEGKYKGKPKIIMLMGTWCPNCLEESKYVVDYMKTNNMGEIEVIAVAFERHKDQAKALQIVKKYRDRLQIPYDILYGGSADKAEATTTLGFVDEITSFPTMLFLNQENQVQSIHTGFNGIATSKFAEFESYFENQVQGLLTNK